MKGGRPLRFLAVTIGGWTAIRVAMLMPGAATISTMLREIVPAAAASIPPAVRSPVATAPLPAPIAGRSERSIVPPGIEAVITTPPTARAATPGVQAEPISVLPMIAPPLRSTPLAKGPSRLAGSAWLLARGGAAGTLSGGQLGASQGGVRLTYALGESRRVALTMRFAAPLSGRGREAAVGVEWRPTRWPVRLIAEQRIALDGGRGGPTIGVIGGYGPGAVLPGVRLEAYGQAGAIARDGVEGFVDLAARVTHPVARMGRATVDLGLGGWGSAQRDAARVDVGPSIGVAVPIADRSVRATLDWRQRIAGAARPGSGPALSIGTDF